MSAAITTTTYINDVWSLYFHDPYDMNWDNNSYKFIINLEIYNQLPY